MSVSGKGREQIMRFPSPVARSINNDFLVWGSIGILISVILAFSAPSLVAAVVIIETFLLLFWTRPKQSIMLLLFLMPIIRGFADSVGILADTPYYINVLGLITILLILLVPVHLLLSNRFRGTYLSTPILLFLGYFLFSSLHSTSFLMSIRIWVRLAMPITFYFMIVSFDLTFDEVIKFLKVLLLSSLIPLFFGGFQFFYVGLYEETLGLNRILGTLGHPNAYSMFLIIMILVLSYLYTIKAGGINTPIFIGLVSAYLFSLFFTYARVGWGTMLASSLIFGFFRAKRLVVTVAVLVIISFILFPTVADKFSYRIQPDSSFLARFKYNDFSIHLFKINPIFGMGTGSYQLLSTEMSGVVIERYGQALGLAAHNDYLNFLAEGGIIGLFLYLFLMLSSMKLAVKIFKIDDLKVKMFGALLVSVVSAVLIFGLTDGGLPYSHAQLWTLLGLGENLRRNFLSQSSGGRI